MSLPSGQKSEVDHQVYEILSARAERRAIGQMAIIFDIKMTNNEGYPSNFWGNRFRLVVDGTPYAPTDAPNTVVEKGKSDEAKVIFVIPQSTTKLVLKVGQVGQATDDIPIDLSKGKKD